jgi:hypothetical protein
MLLKSLQKHMKKTSFDIIILLVTTIQFHAAQILPKTYEKNFDVIILLVSTIQFHAAQILSPKKIYIRLITDI